MYILQCRWLPSIPQWNHSFNATTDLRGFSWHQTSDLLLYIWLKIAVKPLLALL